MKLCTKCKKELDDGVIFCSGCGTKQYLIAGNKVHQGRLLVQIPKCKLVMLGLVPVECILYVWDNRIAAVGNNGKSYMDLALTAVATVDIVKQTLNIKNMKEKVYQITLPPEEADFIFYVRNLILDYRQGCFETGSFAGVSEMGETADKLAGMGLGLWMKEKPVAEQISHKGKIAAEKLYVAKTGRPFRFAGQIYQNFQQLCVQRRDGVYSDVYGRMGTWQEVRFPIFDSADALHENRYWRYFYMHDREILYLVVFQDEWAQNGHWKSEKENLEMEIFENVAKAGA